MLSDAPEIERMASSSRARVAVLTLQLRQLRHDLAVAETLAEGWDRGETLARLRVQLASQVAARRRACDAELAEAKAHAAAAIAAAHAEAARVTAPATSFGEDPLRPGGPTPSSEDDGSREQPSITVNLDTAALAAAIAAVLDARAPTATARRPVRPAPAPVPVKKSFWSGVFHADVVMSLVAMVIVVVVLIAWST